VSPESKNKATEPLHSALFRFIRQAARIQQTQALAAEFLHFASDSGIQSRIGWCFLISWSVTRRSSIFMPTFRPTESRYVSNNRG
jgi:hypothetical protein